MAHASLPPELLILISKYFTPEEALAPSLACRFWHSVFTTVVWRCYTIKPRKTSPTIETRTKNAHHVRELHYLGTQLTVEDDLVVPYTRLTNLWFLTSYNDSVDNEQLWIRLTQLIARNQELQEAVISDPVAGAPVELWQTVISLPVLRTLEIRDVCMQMKHWEAIWNGCKGLRTLRMYNMHSWDRLKINDEVMEKHTELESMTLQDSHYLPLLKHCPNLRHVSWENRANSALFLKMLAVYLSEGRLGQLERLHTRNADDRMLASTLKAMNQIKELSVQDGKIEDLSLQALTQHFTTLQVLTLPTNMNNAGDFVSTVLASCPKLTTFTAPMVTATEIIDGEPWVCSSLTNFDIIIEIEDAEEDKIRNQSREIFGRLSSLTYLTELRIRSFDTLSAPTLQGLEFRLESGLGQLSTLTQLKLLDFSGTIQNMSVDDVKWIRDSWKRIELVLGKCNEHGLFQDQPGIAS
ncbi:MAG: hypothetical protein BYD32DRAFT_431525 [Podila humilis]|nr:MAG: hypothetical protein BYD32DRAFT_431525 [Podila humilis]